MLLPQQSMSGSSLFVWLPARYCRLSHPALLLVWESLQELPALGQLLKLSPVSQLPVV